MPKLIVNCLLLIFAMIFIDKTATVLEWHQRRAIAIGTAKGLRFLHKECRGGPIIHRDMRPSNILLTHDFVPMVYLCILFFCLNFVALWGRFDVPWHLNQSIVFCFGCEINPFCLFITCKWVHLNTVLNKGIQDFINWKHFCFMLVTLEMLLIRLANLSPIAMQGWIGWIHFHGMPNRPKVGCDPYLSYFLRSMLFSLFLISSPCVNMGFSD